MNSDPIDKLRLARRIQLDHSWSVAFQSGRRGALDSLDRTVLHAQGRPAASLALMTGAQEGLAKSSQRNYTYLPSSNARNELDEYDLPY